ncbi:MAG: sugar phosphate nucleotidyltransferase [Caldilineales bacterium]|nr:sugar phosphate nucleotidyltransferase [Caldilineales bacterium]MDW8318858.1 mannose-1-phosphate guanylyltransferase [Anaerolineae bacterium]
MNVLDRLVVVVLAGGSGTRLWPRSRQALPKQFLDLTGQGTMLQETLRRLAPLAPPDRILVITNADYVDLVRDQVPELPPDHVVGEPLPRGTAAAVGLGAVLARHLRPDAIMASVHADHLILRPDRLRAALVASAEVADRGHLVTLGIKPTYPHTGLGYVEQGEALPSTSDGHQVFRVVKFTEKPNLSTAERFVADGRHSWNSGLFTWRVDRILAEFAAHMPELYAGLQVIAASLGTPEADATLQRVFPTLPHQTIDYGIMERAQDVAVLPVDIGWTDIGSWATLLEVLDGDSHGNVIRGDGTALTIDTHNSLIYTVAGRLVAAIGVKDLVIVDCDDALLICPKDRAQDVRRVVEELQRSGREAYLR